jgi:peptidyl-prolyl cis-trans isomerase C
MKRSILTVAAIAASVLMLAGCGREKPIENEDSRIVAVINNYELTAGDLKRECNPQIMERYFRKDPEAFKQETLDAIIMRKILLQEAQKEGIDKDRAFMDEIERYWESTLIILLMDKKEKELLAESGITDRRKITPADQKKLQEAMGAWLAGLKENSTVMVDERTFKEIKID